MFKKCDRVTAICKPFMEWSQRDRGQEGGEGEREVEGEGELAVIQSTWQSGSARPAASSHREPKAGRLAELCRSEEAGQ